MTTKNLVLVFGGISIAFVACTFPDINFYDVTGGPGAGGTTTSTASTTTSTSTAMGGGGASSTSAGGGGNGGHTTSSAGGGGASSSSTGSTGGGGASSSSSGSTGGGGAASSSSGAGGASSSSGAGGNGGAGGCMITNVCPRDNDCDGLVSWECPGGMDCGDGDPNAKPGQLNFFPTAMMMANGMPKGGLGFDYNCDGVEEKDPALTQNLVCKLFMGLCSGTGYQGSPKCGASGPYGHCGLNAQLACVFMTDNPSRIQSCR